MKHSVAVLISTVILTLGLPGAASGEAITLNVTLSSLPVLPRAIAFDLTNGDGLVNSSAVISYPGLSTLLIEGNAASGGNNSYLLSDSAFLSSVIFDLAGAPNQLAFGLNLSLAPDSGLGFPDALVVSFLTSALLPAFPTSDLRGTDAALVFTSAGPEQYVSGVTVGNIAAVPEPSTAIPLLCALALGLCRISRLKRLPLSYLLVAVCLVSGGSLRGAVSDVTSSVSIARTSLAYNRNTNTFSSVVTVTNRASITLRGPVRVAVTNVPTGVSLANGVGLTQAGSPYVTLIEANGTLGTGQSASGVLQFHNPDRVLFTAGLQVWAELGTTVPDPGPAGRLTLSGIDTNSNQVRDDVEVFIEIQAADSAKHREALKSYAAAVQQSILSQTKAQAIQAATAEVRAIECLEFIGKRTLNRWKDVLALMLNTDARIRAHEAFNDLVNGEVFAGLAASQRRTACTFNPDNFPN